MDQTRGRQRSILFGCARLFQTYKGKGIGTEEFRSFWKPELGDKKSLLDVWLDSNGGLPEVGKRSERLKCRTFSNMRERAPQWLNSLILIPNAALKGRSSTVDTRPLFRRRCPSIHGWGDPFKLLSSWFTSSVFFSKACCRISACCFAVGQSCFSTASVRPGNSRCA